MTSANNTQRQTQVRGAIALVAVIAVAGAVFGRLAMTRNSAGQKYLTAGSAHYQAGRLGEAASSWEEALRAAPSDPLAYELLSKIYLENGAPDRALPLLKRLIQLAPNTPEVYSQLAEAMALTSTGNAMEAAKRAVAKEPGSAKAHVLLGIQLSNQQDHATAIAELTRATLLAPNDDKIATSLGQAQLNAADLAGAEKTARGVLKRTPSFTTAWFVLGWAFSRQTPTPENLKEGIAAFEKALELKPDQLEARAELGRLFLAAGQPQKAKEALETVWMGIKTDNVAFQLSNVYKQLGDTQKAQEFQKEFNRLHTLTTQREALRKRFSTNPQDVETATELAKVELGLDNRDETAALLQGILQAKPDSTEALEMIVELFKRSGDSARGEEYQTRLTKLREGKEGRQ